MNLAAKLNIQEWASAYDLLIQSSSLSWGIVFSSGKQTHISQVVYMSLECYTVLQ